MAVPIKAALPPGMTVEEFERLNDLSTAYHEAGHAVAAWMQGCAPSMQYVQEREPTNRQDLSAVTTHDSITRFVKQQCIDPLQVQRGVLTDSTGANVGSIDDGGVFARQQAFITLAGPLAEFQGRDSGMPDSVRETSFREHAIEAHSKLLNFTREHPDELQLVYRRIVDLAALLFAQPQVVQCVRVLAEKFHKARSLSEQEVRETIEHAWNGFAEANAATAGK